MKNKFTSRSVLSNLRVIIPPVLLSSAISLAVFATGTPLTLKPVSAGTHHIEGSSLTQAPSSQHMQPSDTVQEAWVARYNGPANLDSWAEAIAVDASGNVYVTGWSIGAGTGYDYATIKYDPNGQAVWVARYNGAASGDDYGRAIAIDSSGNVYVTGQTAVGALSDYATIKYNSIGQEQWVARYNGPVNGENGAFAIAVDASGNVYVTGYSLGGGTGYDYATVKYNSSGQEQWIARYNGTQGIFDAPTAIAIDGSGNVYVTGYSDGPGTGDDYATVKYNSTGQEQWVARYNGPANGEDVPAAIAIDTSGNVYVTGYSDSPSTRDDYATIKYNSSGQEQWIARYNGPGNSGDEANAIALDGLGNVYVTGQSGGTNTIEYATVKYNSVGEQQWVARYHGPANSGDEANAIALDGSGNVYVTGQSGGTNTTDYATVKYNSVGEQRWAIRYDGPGEGPDGAAAIAVDRLGSVYVTGLSYVSGNGYEYATIKYVQDTGCDSGIIVNGGFETLDFTGWTIDGFNLPPVVNAENWRTGHYSASLGQCGNGVEATGDSAFYQQFTVPADGGTLSFWHSDCTTDTITFDWQDAYITDSSGNILQTIFHQCSNALTWLDQQVDLAPYAGQTVRIKFLVHQDGFGDRTGMYVDDVQLSCPSPTPTPTVTPTPTPRPHPTPRHTPTPHPHPTPPPRLR